jgi:hypothetical protein
MSILEMIQLHLGDSKALYTGCVKSFRRCSQNRPISSVASNGLLSYMGLLLNPNANSSMLVVVLVQGLLQRVEAFKKSVS